jgi:hypothetical protein
MSDAELAQKKYYRYEEDELIDNVNDIESMMKQSMAYLDDVDGMMNGDDLAKITRMIKLSKESMGHHMNGVDIVRDNVSTMNGDALDVMDEMAHTSTDNMKWVTKARKKMVVLNKNHDATLATVEEDDIEDPKNKAGGMQMGGISMGGGKATEIPLEKHKSDIVKQLLSMQERMKDFSSGIEDKMDHIYKGGQKK